MSVIDEDEELDEFKTMEDVDFEANQKGEAVQAQLAIWERIMHLTIKSHAALRVFNQLPRGDLAKDLNKNAEDETKANLMKVRRNIFETTTTLLDIEKMFTDNNKNRKDDSDEEIESSEDEKEEANGKDSHEANDDESEEEDEDDEVDENEDEIDNDDDDEEESPEHSTKINRDHSVLRLQQLQKALSSCDAGYSKTRSSILTKWDDRTRLVGKRSKNKELSAMESSIMKQIDQVLNDKYRLLRRTQTKRSDNDRLGSVREALQDPQIFDDDDFYQALLKDFIDQKSAQTNDPVAMSRQYLELQQLRQKRTKKVVDNKATRERKIRYVTIPKMVNFFPACPESVEWPQEKRNELFKSLFK